MKGCAAAFTAVAFLRRALVAGLADGPKRPVTSWNERKRLIGDAPFSGRSVNATGTELLRQKSLNLVGDISVKRTVCLMFLGPR
jgi:hypothetical protein